MTKSKLEEIKKAYEKGTPGAYFYNDRGVNFGFYASPAYTSPAKEDYEFCVQARQWVPELVREIEILQEALRNKNNE